MFSQSIKQEKHVIYCSFEMELFGWPCGKNKQIYQHRQLKLSEID